MKKTSIAIVLAVLLFTACSKHPVGTPLGSVLVSISYQANHKPLLFDSLMFNNEAGNTYSVTKLEYLVSDVVFHGERANIKVPGVFYVNANKQEALLFDSVPPGTYHSISFVIGLKPEKNITGGLPSNSAFNGMYWPVQMGGGYHFLKLEGRFLEGPKINGFAIHLGNNENHSTCNLAHRFDVKNKNQELSLVMDINEWFTNPNKYDFNIDGNYSMGEMTAMKKISKNGASVFSVKTGG